jgi:hypothetical protein
MALGSFAATFTIVNDGTIAAGGAKLAGIIEGLRWSRQNRPPAPVRAR